VLPPFDLQAQVCIDASRNDGFLANRIVAESLLCCQRIAVPGWLASGAALPSMARQQRMRSVIVDLLPESVTPEPATAWLAPMASKIAVHRPFGAAALLPWCVGRLS
jgi:hypothetical protein